jgi:excisionase family DNA binding protein
VTRTRAGSEWLALGPASRLLGVDPGTLRRWADTGRIAAFVTPGGHRRFSLAAVEGICSARETGRPSLAWLGATPEHISAVYRRTYETRTRPADGSLSPRSVVPAPDREPYRRDGRLLVGVLVAYVDATDARSRVAAESAATELTIDLARRIAGGGISLTEGVGLFVAGRRPFLSELGVLARRQGLGSAGLAALYETASGLLDQLLMVFIDAHRQALRGRTETLAPAPDDRPASARPTATALATAHARMRDEP